MKTESSPWQRFHDWEAESYDQLCYTQDTAREVPFIVEVLGLPAGAAILDVGCGTGRHAVALARLGYRVTGLDFSAGMLAQAREKARAAGVALERGFDAAICICEGSFGLLGAEDDAIEQPLAILRNVARALRPEGRALFTILSAFKMIRERTPEDLAQGRFDPLAMSTLTDMAPGEGEPPLRLRERAFTPTEIKLLFRLAGLRVLNIWGGTAGNWGKRAIELDEFEIMVVAEKPGE